MASFAVIGPGAVGTIITESLLAAEKDVVLFGRREQQVMVRFKNNTEKIINVTNLTLSRRTYDYIFVAVKVTQLESILPAIERLSHNKTVIILCQNGMGQLELLKGFNSFQAAVYISGKKTGRNIQHYQDKQLILPASPSTKQLLEDIKGSDLQIVLSEDANQLIWYKLLVNVGINTVTALSKNTAHILELPSILYLTELLLKESIQVANADGQKFTQQTVDDIIAIYHTYDPLMGTSMYYDVMNNAATEYLYIQGTVKRLAEQYNIKTPVLDTCAALLEGYQYKKINQE